MTDKFKPRFNGSKVHALKNPFKGSSVRGFNRILFGFLILTLELLNPLNLERASAQAHFIKVKPSASSSA